MTTVLVSQLNYAIGDISHNYKKILSECMEASSASADIVIFGRYAISGYFTKMPSIPGEFVKLCEKHVEFLAANTKNLHVLLGGISEKDGILTEVIYLISDGKHEKLLEIPVFSHDASERCVIFHTNGLKIGLLLEEYTLDNHSRTWHDSCGNIPDDIELLILLGRSPHGSYGLMNRNSASVIMRYGKFIYLNMLGGYESNVFSGGSIVHSDVDSHALALWKEDKKVLKISPSASQLSNFTEGNGLDAIQDNNKQHGRTVDFENAQIAKSHDCDSDLIRLTQHINLTSYSYEEFIYQLLVLSLRDFVEKNAFTGVLLGLSGGIDSALVATIAADALGSERVHTFMLPTMYTSQSSITDAQNCAAILEVFHSVVSIEDIFLACIKSLSSKFDTSKLGTTEENIQSRIRGMFLMAVSNKTNLLLLATGNRSELLTGYMTLYGDTCGGFAPIKDLYKTQVYDLVKWRNSNVPSLSLCPKTNVIPKTVINKAPTAELKFNQKDQDLLPEYSKLDKMLSMLIDRRLTKEALISSGYDSCEVELVINMVQKSHFKLNQVAPGPGIMRTLANNHTLSN